MASAVHDTKVVMKDGTVHVGPIHLFMPMDGYMILTLDDTHYPDGAPDKLFFRDMRSATTQDQRMSVDRTGTQDELQRARLEGWDGR